MVSLDSYLFQTRVAAMSVLTCSSKFFGIVAFALFSASCSDEAAKISCRHGFEPSLAYLYASPLESYLFYVADTRTLYSYTLNGNTGSYRELQTIFESGVGRDVGVEAMICGRAFERNSPSSLYDAIEIDKVTILRPVDMTDMISERSSDLGRAPPPVEAKRD